MKVLHSGDWHLDLANLAYTVPAIKHGIAQALGEGTGYDLFVHAGDLVVNRSNVHPHVAHEVRLLIESAAYCRNGAIVIAGNHDQSFQAERVGMVEGILGGASFQNIEIASVLSSTIRRDSAGYAVGFVMVPTPNKYAAKAAALAGDDLVQAMTLAVQAEIETVRGQGADAVVVIYHGTVSGAMLSDEQQMPSGVDLALPSSAFAGAKIVLAGHIHKRQLIPATPTSPLVVYCGSPAPLNWGEAKASPAMYLIEIVDEGVSLSSIPLPVVSQMIDVIVECSDGDEEISVADAVWKHAPGAGDRVRVRVRGAGAQLDALRLDLADALAAEFSLLSCKVITERTDASRSSADVGISDSIEAALEKWITSRGLVGVERDRLLAFAREVEGRVVDLHLDARYEMRPRSLRVSNWCQYGEAAVTFDDLEGLTVIDGANYSGKSNISRALLFALYKWQVRGARLVDAIRKGEDAATVEFDFSAHGRNYRVIREIRRTSAGATASLHFLDMAGGVAEPLAEGTSRETQAAIEKIVGPLDLFLATAFAGQNEIDALLDLSPADLKDLLMRLLQRDFSSRNTFGKQVAAEHDGACSAARNRIAGASAALVPVDDGTISRLAAKGESLKAEVEAGRENVERLVESVSEYRSRIAALDADALKVQAAARRAEQAARAVETLEDRIAELADASRQAEAVEIPAEPRPSSFECGDLVGRLLDEQARSEAGRSAGRRAVVDVYEAARDRRLAAVRDLDQLSRDVRQVSGDLGRARVAASLIDTVPCGGELLNVPERCGDTSSFVDRDIDCEACPLLVGAVSARESIIGLEARVSELEADRDRLGAEALALLDEEGSTRQAVDKFDALIGVAVADLNAAMQDAQRAAVEARQVEADRHREQARYESLRSRAAMLPQYESTLAAAVAEALALSVEAGEVQRRLDGSADAHTLADVAALDLARAREGAVRAEAELLSVISAEAALSGQRDRNRDTRERIEADEREISRHEAEAITAYRYAEAMHRDGIPFLMLEQFSIPLLQQVANEYLSGTGFSLVVEAERELQSGETRSAVEISFADHRGRHPIAVASGAQRTAIGSSLRHAMAEILARGTGSKIWLAVQDEGFGTLDPENLEIAKRTLKNIAARRGAFIVISHVPGLAEVADHVLRVYDDGGTSRIEVA